MTLRPRFVFQSFDQFDRLCCSAIHPLKRCSIANRASVLLCFVNKGDGARSDETHQGGQRWVAQVCDRHRHQLHRNSRHGLGWSLLLSWRLGRPAKGEDLQDRFLPLHYFFAEQLRVNTHGGLQFRLSPPAPLLFESDIGEAGADRGDARDGLKPIRVQPTGDNLNPSHGRRASTVRSTDQCGEPAA